jgi:hypothetical protein
LLIDVLFPWSQPNAHNDVELQHILCFCNFKFSMNLHLIFLVMTTYIYSTLFYNSILNIYLLKWDSFSIRVSNGLV